LEKLLSLQVEFNCVGSLVVQKQIVQYVTFVRVNCTAELIHSVLEGEDLVVLLDDLFGLCFQRFFRFLKCFLKPICGVQGELLEIFNFQLNVLESTLESGDFVDIVLTLLHALVYSLNVGCLCPCPLFAEVNLRSQLNGCSVELTEQLA
jgi:hypothetical protein